MGSRFRGNDGSGSYPNVGSSVNEKWVPACAGTTDLNDGGGFVTTDRLGTEFQEH